MSVGPPQMWYGARLETPMYQLIQNIPTNIHFESLLRCQLPLTRDDSE